MTIESVPHLFDPQRTRRLVLKIGSALLVSPDGRPKKGWLASMVGEINEARGRGQEIIVVSSGAVALGAASLGLASGGRGSLADKQAAAAVGQIELSSLWATLLDAYGLKAAQLLLTLDDLDDRRRYLNASATIGRLLKAGAVPIVNENDSVATASLRFGDNDRLAARVALAGNADAVVLLSDIDGLYDRNPAHPEAEVQERIDGVTPEVHAMASSESSSGVGTGGMTSKLKAAEIAERAGIAMAILNGTYNRPIARALERDLGTIFLPQRQDAGRKVWIGGRQRMEGMLTVDEGCVQALGRGNSLLAAGITRIEGEFKRGVPVGVRSPEGRQVAQGLVEYSSSELDLLKGHRTEEHESLLGYPPRSAVIHRDHLVLL